MDLRRIIQFTWVVARYWTVPFLVFVLGRREPVDVVGARLRITFEAMGVMYLKLGQFLAVRFDLLPAGVLRELEKLFENTNPMPFERVRVAIERELGQPVENIFLSVDARALGSASIAQVHRALTHTGQDVALKVQRPEVRAIFESDLRNLERLAWTIDAIGLVHGVRLWDVVQEFGSFTRREMDFLHEAATMQRVYQQHSPYLGVPRVDWSLTTPRLLTMEFVPGISLSRLLARLESGDAAAIQRVLPAVDLAAVAERLAQGMLNQVFVAGFFQADPHPGNVLIRPDGAVVLVDFGIFGELDRERVDTLSRYVEAVSLGRVDEAFRLYSRLVTFSPQTNVDGFRRGVKAVLRRYYRANTDPSAPQHDRQVGRLGDELLRLLYEYHVRLDLNTLLFWRALIVLDSTFLRWPGGFDLQLSIQRFFRQVRPRPTDRVFDLVDPVGLSRIHEATRGLVQQVGLSLADIDRRRRGPRVRLQRAPGARDRERPPVRRLAMLGAATSVGILVVLSGWSVGGAVVAALGSLCAGVMCILLVWEARD